MGRFLMRFLLAIFLLTYNTGLLAEPRTITWDDLSPPKELGTKLVFDKKSAVKGIPGESEFDGGKEELSIFLDDMNFLKSMQRKGGFINSKLNKKKIKLAGYVTPLSFDGDKVTEFLFVPYKGACIHVPPPPANQIIYVKSAEGLGTDDLYFPVWIIGVLRANSVSTVMAEVGYSIEKATVFPYKRNVFQRLFDLK